MKSLKIFITLMGFALMVTSCNKESVEINSEQQLLETAKKSYNDFQKEGKEFTIEYTTLEDLNELFVQNELEPITLEDLGITAEEYQLAQEQRNAPGFVRNRCNAWYWFLGDMSGNGNVSGFDLVLARRVILGIDPPSNQSENFGTISYWWNGTNEFLSTFDIVIMQQMILEIITC